MELIKYHGGIDGSRNRFEIGSGSAVLQSAIPMLSRCEVRTERKQAASRTSEVALLLNCRSRFLHKENEGGRKCGVGGGRLVIDLKLGNMCGIFGMFSGLAIPKFFSVHLSSEIQK
jgi:hypothetical protein